MRFEAIIFDFDGVVVDSEALANERFGKGVRLLNKVEASGLIDELLDIHGGTNRQGTSNRRNGSAYSGGSGRRAA